MTFSFASFVFFTFSLKFLRPSETFWKFCFFIGTIDGVIPFKWCVLNDDDYFFFCCALYDEDNLLVVLFTFIFCLINTMNNISDYIFRLGLLIAFFFFFLWKQHV